VDLFVEVHGGLGLGCAEAGLQTPSQRRLRPSASQEEQALPEASAAALVQTWVA